MKAAILIPVFNEERTIAVVLREAKKKNDHVIVVIDGSTDRSLEIASEEEGVHVLVNEENLGLAGAIKVGLKYALQQGFDTVIKIDGDGQMNLERYDELVALHQASGADVVLARYNRDTPWMIKKDIWLYSWLFRLATRVRVSDVLSEYRLLSRRAMEEFISAKIRPFASNVALVDLVKAGCSVREIKGGVNYSFRLSERRPAHWSILIDCRVQFVRALWTFGTWRSRAVSAVSVVPLALLLLTNVTLGARYNTLLSKKRARK